MKSKPIHKPDDVSKVNALLKVILWLAIGISILFILASMFMPSFGLDFDTDQGVVTVEMADLPFSQRIVVVFLFSISIFCWIGGLLALLKMSCHFSSGRIFTLQNIQYVRTFALALLFMAALDVFGEYFAAKYLIAVDYLDATVSFNFVRALGQMDYLVSSLLILLICQVLRQAVALSEDAELTV